MQILNERILGIICIFTFNSNIDVNEQNVCRVLQWPWGIYGGRRFSRGVKAVCL